MALLRLKREDNVPGEFYVDSTCIDCDLCRQIAPHTFKDAGDQSTVYHQPQTDAEIFDATRALVTCPTASIGTVHHLNAKEAVEAYPEQIEGGVYFCGFAAESSFGASSYLILHPEGNLLIDSPRFAKPLVRRIEKLGGVQKMLMTHRDDVADHEQWAKHFDAERMIHANDAGRHRMERILEGNDPIPIYQDFIMIPTPGHTPGHVVYLFGGRYLFTGDHMWWSDNFKSLNASRSVCWYSWPKQIQSMKRLRDYDFEWVLPGHGRRIHAPAPQMRQYLEECISRM